MASYDDENWSSATGGSGIYLSSKQLFSNRFGFVWIRFSPRRRVTRSSASMLSSYYGGDPATWDLTGQTSPSAMATVISNDPCSALERSAIYSMPAMIPLVRVCSGKSAIENHMQKITCTINHTCMHNFTWFNHCVYVHGRETYSHLLSFGLFSLRVMVIYDIYW